jgi:hypothetical protein
MKTFDEKCDQRLENALNIVRWVIYESTSQLIMNLIGLAAKYLPHINETLQTNYFWSSTNFTLYGKTILEKHEWIAVNKTLQDYLINKSSFYAKVNFANEILKNFTSDPNSVTDSEESMAMNAINEVIEDNGCNDVMKNNIKLWINSERSQRFIGIYRIFNEFIKSESNSETYFHLRNCISLIIQISRESNNTINTNDLLSDYINAIVLNDNENFTHAKERLKDMLTKNNIHQILSNLYKYSYDSRLFIVHQEFERLSHISDENSVLKLLNNLYKCKQIDVNNWNDIWLNESFVYLIRNNINDARIKEKIAFSVSKMDISMYYLPEPIKRIINPILEEQSQQFNLPESVANIDDLLLILKKIIRLDNVPNEFNVLLVNSLGASEELEKLLIEIKALPFRDTNKKYIIDPWDINTIKSVVEAIESYRVESSLKEEEITKLDAQEIVFNIEVGHQNIESYDSKQSMRCQNHEFYPNVSIGDSYASVIGKSINRIMPNDFIKINQILAKPNLSSND